MAGDQREPSVDVDVSAVSTNGHSHITSLAQLEHKLAQKTDADPIQVAVRSILESLNLDPDSEHFRDTPRRVASALREFRQGADLHAILRSGFENGAHADTGAMVVQASIPIRSMCPHHLMVWHGTTDVAYIPGKRIVGLSKIARVVQAAGLLMPATQEHVTNVIADVFGDTLVPVGTYVITSAVHGCMSCRGVNVPGVTNRVSAIRGLFVHSSAARSEALALMKTS